MADGRGFFGGVERAAFGAADVCGGGDIGEATRIIEERPIGATGRIGTSRPKGEAVRRGHKSAGLERWRVAAL